MLDCCLLWFVARAPGCHLGRELPLIPWRLSVVLPALRAALSQEEVALCERRGRTDGADRVEGLMHLVQRVLRCSGTPTAQRLNM